MPVTFDEAAHKYTSHTGEQYVSATQLIGRFKQKFDPHKITKGGKSLVENYAEKHGGTVEYWLNKWDQTRDEACERGHRFHKAKEDYINGRGVVVFKNQITYVQNASLVLSAPDLSLLRDGLYTELLLWDDAWKLAGQADIVVISTENGIRYVDIDDHKTNRRIDKTSYQDKSTGMHRMMLYPLNHLMDCNLQHYELQLSIYMYMLERNGFTPRSMQFTHYGHAYMDDLLEVEVTPEPVVYPLTYRKKEVLAMLTEHRKHEQRQKRAQTIGDR